MVNYMDDFYLLTMAGAVVAFVLFVALFWLEESGVKQSKNQSPKNQNDLSDPNKIRDQMRDEMKDFTQRLKKIDDDAIGSLLVGATMVRLNLEQHNNVPAHVLTDGLEENSSLKVTQFITSFWNILLMQNSLKPRSINLALN